jgi:hypothetical protein
MFTWDDILILGDSFVEHRDDATDWPQSLTLQLTGEPYESGRIPRGQGFPGASWWSTRNRLWGELSVRPPKVLILTHTDSHRLPSDHNFGINSTSAERKHVFVDDTNRNNYVPEIAEASKMYFKYLMSEQYHAWSQQQWFKELDDTVADIPHVIHLHSFVNSYTFKTGITSKEILFEIGPKMGSMGLIGLRNHYTTQQNLSVAEALYQTITTTFATGLLNLKLLESNN